MSSNILETDESLRLEFIAEVNRSLAQSSLSSLGVQVPRKCLGIDRPYTPLLTSPTPFQHRSRSVTPTQKRLSPLARPHTSLSSPKTPKPATRRRQRPQTTIDVSSQNNQSKLIPNTFAPSESTFFGASNFPHFHTNPPNVIASSQRASTAPTNKKRQRKRKRRAKTRQSGEERLCIPNKQYRFKVRSGFPKNCIGIAPFPLVLVNTVGKALESVDLTCWKFSSKGGGKRQLNILRGWSSNIILSLNLSDTNVAVSSLDVLQDLPSLNTVLVENCPQLTSRTMSLLSRCKSLTTVSLRNSPNAVGMPEMMPLLTYLYSGGRNVEDLVLNGTFLNDEALDSIASLCIHLRRLSIGDNENTVTSAGIHEVVCRCRTLRVLETERNIHVTGRSFLMDGAAFAGGKLSNHRMPQISPHTPESERTAETYGAAPLSLRLNKVSMLGCTQTNNRTVQILAIANHEHLKSVNLSGCRLVGDEACRYLSEFCPSLEEVSLGGCVEVTSSGVTWLVSKGGDKPGLPGSKERLPVLKRINMYGLYRIHDTFLLAVARSSYILRFEAMEFKGTSITDDGLVMLVRRLDSDMGDGSMSYEYAFEEKEKMSQAAANTKNKAKTNTGRSITRCDFQDCKALTPKSIKLFLGMTHTVKLIYLDIRGCSGATQVGAADIAILCAATLKTLKLGFGLAAIKAPPQRKPWHMPTAQQGPSDRAICDILSKCRKLETLVIHGCHQISGSSHGVRGVYFVTPHPHLFALDFSGCSSLTMSGLNHYLCMAPMVRHLDVSYTPLTKTTSNIDGRGALVYMASQRLRVSPLLNEAERKRKRRLAEREARKTFSGLEGLKLKDRQTNKAIQSIVGWTVDPKIEAREKWWEECAVINRASSRIQLGWNIWWMWTTEKRGGTALQKLYRGYTVRLRYWRKRQRALERKQLKDARHLMQRVGHGYTGRQIAKKKKKQMNSVNYLFAKQMTTTIEFTFQTWKRNAYITKNADVIRKRIWDRARLERMMRTIDRWLNGINLQVYAVLKIQGIVRIYLALRERRRRVVQRKFDSRYMSMVKVQAWWRGMTTRNRLMCTRLTTIPGQLLKRCCLLFRGGIGWKNLDKGVSTHMFAVSDKGTGKDKNMDRTEDNILSMHFPTLFQSSPLVTIDKKMQDKEKRMIRSTINLEKDRICWGEAVRSWKETVLSLLRKGDLEMLCELQVLERIMAMERGRGRIHECIGHHDRAIRVCVNMYRNGDYKALRRELCDRLQLYKRRRMLLREFMRYRMVAKEGTVQRIIVDDDRKRRIQWWAIRQMYRTMGRHYEQQLMKTRQSEKSLFQAWSNASELSLDAHVKWSKARIQYQKAYSVLVGEGSAGIGAFMLSTVVNNRGSDTEAKLPPSSIVRNVHYATSEKARRVMETSLAMNNQKACELEQMTIELETVRAEMKTIHEARRRCHNRSIFAVSVRTGSHEELSTIIPPLI
jgi:hypothetical protein